MTTEDYREYFFHTDKGNKVNIDTDYLAVKIPERVFLQLYLTSIDDTYFLPHCISYIAFFFSIFLKYDIGMVYTIPIIAFLISGLFVFLPYTTIHSLLLSPILGKLYRLTSGFFLHSIIVLIVSLVLLRPILFLVYLGVMITRYAILFIVTVFLYKITQKINTYSFSVTEIICFNWIKYYSREHKSLFSVIKEYKMFVQNKFENPIKKDNE